VVLEDDISGVGQVVEDEEAVPMQAGVCVFVGVDALSDAARGDQASCGAAAAYRTQEPKGGLMVKGIFAFPRMDACPLRR
jgi:hypothetical protein